jgi:hypothetical protein
MLEDPVCDGLIVKVALPELVMLGVSREVLSPFGVERVKATVELNPFSELRLMVDVP